MLTMAILINAHQITQNIASRTLFKKLSFGIEDGDRIGLVGPNGAGKSTLLKILVQEIKSDEGQITWKKGLKMGYLPQVPVFKPGATLFETLESACKDQDIAFAKTYEWMSRLDLINFEETKLVSELSGGWQKRLALACELINEPDLLFLDEPTNHLDIESILWLEDFITNAPPSMAIMTVTHDRLFLQRVSNAIWDLDPKLPQNLLVSKGSYADYLDSKDLLIQGELHRESVLKNTLRRETEWLRRGAKARQTKQKARIQSAHELADNVDEVQNRNRVRKININFESGEKNPKKLIEAQNLSKSFGDRKLFENFDYLISPKTRLALLGPNGVGKTTLIKVMLGLVPSDTGVVKLADNVKINYFEQTRDTLEKKKSVLKNICSDGDYVYYKGNYVYARSYLERFGFFREQADILVEKISGGEQARLRLAQMMLMECNVLVLDEPTNDLDVETLNTLEETLNEFDGAVILVTHDRYFMDQVAHEILVFPEMIKFADYLQWEAWKENQKNNPKAAIQAAAPVTSTAPVAEKKPGKLSFKETFELENMEKSIQEVEQKLNALQLEVEKPEVVSKASKVQELYAEIAKLQKQIETSYERWTFLDKKLKGE